MAEMQVLQEQKPAQPGRDFLNSAMIRSIEWPRVRRYSLRTVCFDLSKADLETLILCPRRELKVKPRNLRSQRRATALFLTFTLSRKVCSIKRLILCFTPFACTLTAHVDLTVIGVANKGVSSLFQFPVQFVEHDVG